MSWLGLKKAFKKSLALKKAPIAYHGSTQAFEEHTRPKKDPKATLNYGPGIYYATDPEEASSYAEPQIARVDTHAQAFSEVQKDPQYKIYRDKVAQKFGLSSSTDTRHKNWEKFADHMFEYDKQKVAEKLGLTPNVRRADVQVKNPFNPHDPKHAIKVYQTLGHEPNMFRLKNEAAVGANLYHHIAHEIPAWGDMKWGERTWHLNRAIKRAGFDGIHDQKLGHIIAFSPKQVKPAFGSEKAPKKMAASELDKAVRGPRKGHTIAQLERLKEMGWHNPDTGTEISEGEGEVHLMQLRQQKADKQLKQMIKPKKPKPSTDKPEDWFGSSEKMKKGVARRLFPFNPQKVPETERADVNEWQTYGNEPAPDLDYYRDPQTAREELDPINPHAKQRALLKLASYTKTRKNPSTGEREFLLHRGVLGHEHDYVTEGDNYSYNAQRSSWTPRYDKARSFTTTSGHSSNENMEYPEEESRPGQVISAWIPESKIVHTPYMYGGVSSPHSRGENDYRKEHEIIVAPHKGKMVPHMEAFPPQMPTRANRIAELSHQAKKRAEQRQAIETKMKQPLQPKFPKKPKKTDPNQLELPLAASESYLSLLGLKKKESLYKNLQKAVASSTAPAVKINPEHGKIIANAYENMKHDPNHPEVKAAYGALVDETKKQFKDMLNQGLKISKITDPKHNPYPTSKHLHADVDKGHMWLFPTELGFGSEADMPKDHPMLQPTEFMHEGKPLLANDVFRLVHDSIHHKLRNGFGPKGEHESFLEHKKTYSPLAQKALATETMGQNSYVNFSSEIGHLNQEKPGSAYAPQKAGLLPSDIINGRWHE
jgi:hypothetical protein